MLLQVNSCSSFSVKFHPLQHADCNKAFQSPLTQTNGVVSRGQTKKYSTKGSSQNRPAQSSLSLTNKIRNSGDIINRNQKPSNKYMVPLALQDGYASKSEDDKIISTCFVDVLNKKLDAFYRLSRPYVCATIVSGILSVSLLPIQSLADLTPTFFMKVLMSIVPAVVMHISAAAINQLFDLEIDKINKPYLPLASGDFSKGEGAAIAVTSTLMSLAMGIMLRSPPIVIGLIVWGIFGFAYSVDLPLLRWKGIPFMAALTIVVTNGVLFQFPYFVHVQKYVLGRSVVFTKPFLFTVAFMGIFNTVLAFLKDLPDMKGDKENGLRTLPTILGGEKVFSISVNMLLLAFGSAVLVGASSPFLLCKLVTMICHSAFATIVWRQSQTVDLADPKSITSFFRFIVKLYITEFFLMPFVR